MTFEKWLKALFQRLCFTILMVVQTDESTLGRNTTAYDEYDLIPNGLADVANIDLSTTILGQKVN